MKTTDRCRHVLLFTPFVAALLLAGCGRFVEEDAAGKKHDAQVLTRFAARVAHVAAGLA